MSVAGGIRREPFGRTPDGRDVDLYTLQNDRGMTARIMTFGGSVVSLTAPDREGKMADIVLGYDGLDGYLTNNPYFGGIIGRYANRLPQGRFLLNGEWIQLTCNNGANHLHGGRIGFDKVVWSARPLPESADGPALDLTYVSPDGEEGYPGTLSARVRVTLTHNNGLRFDCAATTDKKTLVNMTHHSYFNLAGQGEGNVLGHEVMIAADAFTPVSPDLILTGEIRPVKGTPFDFTTAHSFAARMGSDDEQLRIAGGYDHNWVLRKGTSGDVFPAVVVFDPRTGRKLSLLTTEPGCQVYTGNMLNEGLEGKEGKFYSRNSGFCLEPQRPLKTAGRNGALSCFLAPGEEYRQTTVYQLSTG